MGHKETRPDLAGFCILDTSTMHGVAVGPRAVHFPTHQELKRIDIAYKSEFGVTAQEGFGKSMDSRKSRNERQ